MAPVQALKLRPRPLVDAANRLVVLWSPRSACTTLYVWFASVCGFAREVRRHSDWPHDHRNQIYVRSGRQGREAECYDPGFAVLRVIRDPYTRAASIYRKFKETKLSRPFPGMDFDRFLDMLMESGDIHCLDSHYWPQLHPFESERRPDATVNISKANMFEALNAFAEARHLPRTDFNSLRWLRRLEKNRAKGRMSYDELLASAARRKIERIYAADFEAYAPYL